MGNPEHSDQEVVETELSDAGLHNCALHASGIFDNASSGVCKFP